MANRLTASSGLNFPDTANSVGTAAPLFYMAQSVDDFSLRFTG